MPESDQMQFLPSPSSSDPADDFIMSSCSSVGIDVRGMNVCLISFASEMLFPCDEVAPGCIFF